MESEECWDPMLDLNAQLERYGIFDGKSVRLRGQPGVGAQSILEGERNHYALTIEAPAGRGSDDFHVRGWYTVEMLTETVAKEFGADPDRHVFPHLPFEAILDDHLFSALLYFKKDPETKESRVRWEPILDLDTDLATLNMLQDKELRLEVLPECDSDSDTVM